MLAISVSHKLWDTLDLEVAFYSPSPSGMLFHIINDIGKKINEICLLINSAAYFSLQVLIFSLWHHIYSSNPQGMEHAAGNECYSAMILGYHKREKKNTT